MSEFNPDTVFKLILTKIESGEIKTTYQLTLLLENLSSEYKIKTLHILVFFREWLKERGIDLITTHGTLELAAIKNK